MTGEPKTEGQTRPVGPRARWILGGVALGVLAVVVAVVLGTGDDEEIVEAQTEVTHTVEVGTSIPRSTPVDAPPAPDSPAGADPEVALTGRGDPEQLRGFFPDGAAVPAETLDSMAISLCNALAADDSGDAIVDMLVGTGYLDRVQAGIFAYGAALEYCPDLA